MDFSCTICPRKCGALRGDEKVGGVCLSPALPRVARCAPHFGEEPCIAGKNGAGAVFFTGCNLRCVFCQNRDISRGQGGKSVTVERLREMLLEIQDQGVDCIDLVTGTHYTPAIAEALSGMKLSVPVVWNSSGYESVETLKLLDGLVQVYMPDFKYWNRDIAKRYSAAYDYPERAREAIQEMFRQVGPYEQDENGLMKKGLLVRHLILPGRQEETMDIIDWLADTFPRDSIMFSLMAQYTPLPGLDRFPELQRTVDSDTNDALIHYMKVRHLEGYSQDVIAATKEMIPDFDGTGV